MQYQTQFIKDENWNAVWESQYEPVLFGNYCFVHAPFHAPRKDVKYNIEIEPKMSFGTAHHPTTALIIEYISKEPLQGKRLLDMGCGTGVLAILASKEGASSVDAIDNDVWAYENTLENIERNHTPTIHVEMGDASNLQAKEYDYIIANINRNILLRDITHYAACLPTGGILLLSGFYQEDIAKLEVECNKHRLFYVDYKTREKWAALKFIKK
ncbi:MAG: 50S ribosomal protein L11 methyltransferase [Bacteroidales bacterium]